ncbi:MAG: HEAT repeat domain-containing protein [Actinomycetota bacterium]|nr:HEAT repeat domain-containing protein [Actinomycetota bacterium]MDH5312822.1 HEAT repeat domain-containing protein [Actinomycetota bacterium]
MAAAGVRRVLGLRPGEERSVAFIVATSFMVSAGLMIGQSAIEALFFARFGVEKLPAMYLILGGTMFLLTLGFGALLVRTGPGLACIAIPFAVAALAIAGRAGLAADITWVPQALWLLQGASYFVLGLAVWGLAGIITDTRQAKRIFPLIGAGGVLGYVVGGIITKPLASWMGTPNLLFVWVATLIGSAVLGMALLAVVGAGGSDRGDRGDRGPGPLAQLTVGMRYVAASSLMRWLALAAVLFSLLFFSLYLPFSRAATLRYPDPDDLAGFFGLFFGISTGLALLVSLLLTNRLLARFGVPAVMLVLPAIYVVAFGVLTIAASFAALAVFRFVQVAWMQGGASSSWEAVINTVPPDRRNQTRAFLYGGPTQIGTILAGVVALVGERAFSPSVLYGVGLACAVLATIAMIGVRRGYPHELVRALREGRPNVFGDSPDGLPTEPFALARDDATALGVVVSGIADPDPRVRQVAATILADFDPPTAARPLRDASNDPDAGVRAAAIGSLAESRDGSSLAIVLERARDPDRDVRRAVVAAIGRLDVGAEMARQALGSLTRDEDPAVRASAAARLAEVGNDPSAIATLVELAASEDDDVRAAAFDAMAGLEDPRLADVALAGLRDPAPMVRVGAARAIPTLDPPRGLDALVIATADPSLVVRRAVARGLGELGQAAVDPVVHSLEDPARRDAALAALERLPLDGRRDEVRRFAERTVSDAVERHEMAVSIDARGEPRLELLRDSLHHRSELDGEDALRAISLADGNTQLPVALDNLSVSDAAQRANALEVIESVTERELVRPLLKIWDGAIRPGVHDDALERSRRDPDDWIRACAELAARRGGPMETLTTLATMERVLFLRKVSLFAELPPPDLAPIAAIASERIYADGEIIAEQGDAGAEMYIIVSGEVAVVTRSDDGDRVIATRTPGDVVGEMSLISSEPRIADLVARGAVRVLSIDRRRFGSILRERPDTSIAVIQVLCRRLAEAGSRSSGGQAGIASEER